MEEVKPKRVVFTESCSLRASPFYGIGSGRVLMFYEGDVAEILEDNPIETIVKKCDACDRVTELSEVCCENSSYSISSQFWIKVLAIEAKRFRGREGSVGYINTKSWRKPYAETEG